MADETHNAHKSSHEYHHAEGRAVPTPTKDDETFKAAPAEEIQVTTSDTPLIKDKQFINELEQTKNLHSFIIKEAALASSPEAEAALTGFSRLKLLHYNAEEGRFPSEDEWNKLDDISQTLFCMLTPPQRRRFLLGDIHAAMLYLPLLLIITAIVALIGAVIAPYLPITVPNTGTLIFPFYCLWLTSLGGVGAIAFMGMNALSVQEDITFDMSNTKLIYLRVMLGALFALVLSLPFGFPGFYQYSNNILTTDPSKLIPIDTTITPTAKAIMFVLPFLLGFSTSLVILILNRFVAAVQSFFGKGPFETQGHRQPTRREQVTAVRHGGSDEKAAHEKAALEKAKPLSQGSRTSSRTTQAQ